MTLSVVASCTKELSCNLTPQAGDCHIEASIGGADKTSLLDGHKVLWSAGDAIGLFDSGKLKAEGFALESGSGTSCGSFSGNASISSGYAKYPYDASDKYENGIISTSLPSTQQYTAGSFESGVSIMAGTYTAGSRLEFTNLCAIIKMSVLGNAQLSNIIVTANDASISLCGSAAISFGSSGPDLTMTADKANQLTVNCSSTKLSKSEFTDFYIAVPPQMYNGGLSFTFNTTSGSVTKKATSNLNLQKSRIYSIPPFELSLNGGLSPSSSLQGQGTQTSPFLISSVEDLLCIQRAMNDKSQILSASSGKMVTASSAWYLLTKDLDLSACCGPEKGNWMPIGPDSNRFTGHFDGDGHKITGLYINNDSTKGGLFGDIYTGGYLGNLEVSGNVRANNASIICKSNYATMENCISRGSVYSTYSAGGTLNSNAGQLSSCTNYADVTLEGSIYNSAGGICSNLGGGEDDYIINCKNYGTVKCEGGHGKAGGIAGYFQQFVFNSSVGVKSEVADCANYGSVSGAYRAGGITGTFFDCIVTNCANYGDVNVTRTDGLAGGISGELENTFSHNGSKITNCVSTGNVSGNGTLAGICASNSQTISCCYYLYDTGTGVSNGVKGGTVTNVYSLSTAQMKGTAASSTPLYGNYTDPVKALNAWAYENTSTLMPYYGWQYDSGSSLPALTTEAPLPPDGQSEYLSVTPTSITLGTLQQDINLQAKSSSEVSVTNLPSWISSSSITQKGNVYTITLTVEKNTSGGQREGSVTVSNAEGLSSVSTVTQRYAYHSEDYSRDGNIVRLQSHSKGNGIELIFFGDGYTDKDIKEGTYESDMRRGADAFFSTEPYSSYRDHFDVRYVELVSETNTIDGTSGTALSTYFGSGTLISGNHNKVSSLCKTVTGKSDLSAVTAIVILNAKKYAGTCYMYYSYSGDCGMGFSISYFGLGTSTSGQTSMECVLRHESGGHGFAKLADEYAYYNYGTIPSSSVNEHKSLQPYGWYTNVDFTSDPFSVRWSKYIQNNDYSAEQIGVYEGGATYWSGVYRPTLNSIMRYNTGKFNAPSREAIWYKIHRLAYGSSWTYDFNEFLEYDAINRTSVSQTFDREPESEDYVPLHPPVAIYGQP